MKIAYLIDDTAISGGIRVTAAHADALTLRGHEVVMVTRGGPLQWRASAARWRHVASFAELDGGQFDFVVGTFWTTLAAAQALGGPRAVHFCQGYEGGFTAYAPDKPRIDVAYALPLPKITVSEHLVPICRRFFDDVTCIGQIVDGEFYQPSEPRAKRRRVLLVGPQQADFKGIDVGYAAVQRARALGADFELVRVSQWEPAEGEPVDLAAEFHVAIPTAEMVRLIASCDAFLAPSRAEEGFGLPAAEAMAGGLPGVLSTIPSFRSWDGSHDYALWAPEGDGAAMGAELARLLGDDSLADSTAARGREVVEQFRQEKTAERLERWFLDRLVATRV